MPPTVRIGLIGAILGVVLAAPSRLAAQALLDFTALNSGNYLDSTSRMIGWQFTVNSSVTVEQLGWFDWGEDGLAVSHQVAIWDTTDSSQVLSVTIPAGTAATLSDHFRYVAVASPVTLAVGRTYRIAGFDPGSGDPHVWDAAISFTGIEVSGFTVDSRISLAVGTAIGPAVSAFGYPTATIGDARQALMGPNLMVASVPEPSTWLLLGFGAAGLALGRCRRVVRR